MNIHNINVIARYEVKLLKRSWLFRIFAILVLLILTLNQFGNLTSVFSRYTQSWDYTAVTSLIPFFTIYLYNVAQSVIVIFLAGSFLKRDKKLDTAEVIYVRPMSNADYIVGKVWGILRVFIGLNIITLLVAMFINLVINRSPFSLFPYVFYILTISLPSLLFILGLAFTFMCFLKNQAVTFIVMLGLTGTIFFYLPENLYGVFDFFGVNIPALFSDITGHPDIRLFLLQRSIYFLLGLGLLCFTVALVKRLPHRPWKNVVLSISGLVLIVLGLGCGLAYVLHFRHIAGLRQEYAAVYNQYGSLEKANVISNDISLNLQGRNLEGESRMLLRNNGGEELKRVVVWLNPSLQVMQAESNGQPVAFVREKQAIVIDKALKPGEEWPLSLKYRGGIDENICYTDIEDKDFLAHTESGVFFFRYGKRYVYLEDKFTILTPECVWYPVTEAPEYPAVPYNIKRDFTQYTLTVNGIAGKTVLSQGEKIEADGKVRFVNKTLLPGISLTVADYEKKAISVDSTSYEIYYFRGHDDFSKHFSEIQDTLPVVIREIRNDLEVAKNRTYPFDKFVLAETPLPFTGYIRNWKGYTEQVMPEIIFVPERGLTTPADFRSSYYMTKDWRARNEVLEEKDIQVEMLKNYIRNSFVNESSSTMRWGRSPAVNKLNMGAMFFAFTGFIYSSQYPVIDIALNTMQNVTAEGRRMWFFGGGAINDNQRANIYLQEHSFEEALKDRELKPEVMYEILRLKSTFLKNYVLSRVPLKEFHTFLKEFGEKHLFTEVPFADFARAFTERFGLDLMNFTSQWYRVDHSPTVRLKDADANKVLVDDFTKYQVRFKAYNGSDVDAVITVNVISGGGGPGGFRMGGPRNSNAQDEALNYIIPAKSAREVKIIQDERPGQITINTNVSHNLPNEFNFNFSKIDNEISDTTSGIFPVDTLLFRPEPGEIIVDNEDPGFRTIESNQKRKLKDLFKKEEEDKYKNFFPWRFPSKWTAVVNNTCYGTSVNSAVYKSKGKGNNKVCWTAEIPADNYYEIAVWNPKFETWGRRRHGREEKTQTYTVQYDQESETVSIDLGQEENGWVTLGSFYLPKGEVSVTLTDKVSADYVVADAVKFTLRSSN